METLENLSAFQFACVLTIGLLTFGSLAIFVLLRLKPKNQTFQKVAIIIKSWWWISGAFLLALSWYKWGLILGMLLLSLLTIREYLRQSKIEYKKYIGVGLAVLCILQYLILSFEKLNLFLSLVPVLCLWMVPGLVIFRATIKDLVIVVAVGTGLSLMIYYLSYIAALTALPQTGLSHDEATIATVILVFITWSNDIFQFLAGKTFGNRKIVPDVSPNKTLAGFVGGIVGTMLLTGFCSYSLLRFSLPHALVLGFLMGFTGMFGDLFFSAVKRNIGVKDFSQAIPGHGGFLDRLDSLIFTAPIYFHYLLLVAR